MKTKLPAPKRKSKPASSGQGVHSMTSAKKQHHKNAGSSHARRLVSREKVDEKAKDELGPLSVKDHRAVMLAEAAESRAEIARLRAEWEKHERLMKRHQSSIQPF